MLKKNIVTTLLFIIVTSSCLHAQAILDSAKNELLAVNKVFDSSSYIAFNANILYYTDTSYGHFERDEKVVEYYLNNKNYYYKVDGVEYIQNDSFAINIDNEDKTLLVTKNVYNDPSSRFMLKDFIDYGINTYGSVYAIDISVIDTTTKQITFSTADTTLPYKSFSISYDVETYYPIRMEMELTEKLVIEVPSNSLIQPGPLTQKIQISFEGYHSMASGEIFDQNLYFIFDKHDKRYVPAEKYKYYRFLTAGLEQEELPDNPQLLMEPVTNQ